jgi:hypothetical protein
MRGLIMAATRIKFDVTVACRVLLAMAATSLVLFVTSGCGAGQAAQTSQDVPVISGVDASAGPIVLRDLLIPFRQDGYPAGSDVPLVVRMYSNAEQPIELNQVVPAGSGSMTVGPRRISLRRPGTAGRDDAPLTPLVVPAEGALLLVPGSGPYLVAEAITSALRYTDSVPVRFSFSTGDSVQVDVPMAAPAQPIPNPSQVGPSAPPSDPPAGA